MKTKQMHGMVVLRRQLQKRYDKGSSDFSCASKWGRQEALRQVIMAIDDTLKELTSKKPPNAVKPTVRTRRAPDVDHWWLRK